ncbi:testis-specific Y-encoded-like protein 1 [Pipistrellus kuhlii]|uniref:TSPY like 1 n=1 Tax=Pipistrellus kuhlii TaxID=59472 RepID=A0A7J7YQT6_PIPKU|nr:testis-specific Y-encoded-like protein 1 [Pipistrellus kuhlii]KAF6363860.1 TSPY like 1 [Pipistrellus kuhlii]
MSGLAGAEGALHPQTCSPGAPAPAPGQPDPDPSPQLREETEASQVMAEPGEGGSEAVALPPVQLPEEEKEEEEEGASPDPAAGGVGGRAPRTPGGGGDDVGAPEAEPEQAPPPAAAPAAEPVSMATGRGPNNGGPRGPGAAQAVEACGAEKPGSEAVAEAAAAEVNPVSVAVAEAMVEKEGVKEEKGDDEMEMKEEKVDEVKEEKGDEMKEEKGDEEVKEEVEVEEKPVVGEEIEMAEENRAVEAVEEGAEGAGLPRPLNVNFRVNLRMNPLEAIQQELDTVNAQADRAFQQLEQKFGRMRRHYLERRNYIIQNIPGFWVTAFRNHPQLAPMIRGQDAEMLRYITNLEVKEFRHPKTGCKFKFFFRRNPFFRNKLIVKEYEVRAGRVVSLSTPIVWRRGHEPQSFIRRNQDVVCNFFTWFSDHSLPESDKIAEIIKEDLWPNPLQYYLLREGVRRARRRPLREPVEIPRPFGFQSG